MSDLISRDAAIAAIETARQAFALPDDVPGSRLVNAGFAAARGAVEKVPSAPRWISVKELLPKDGVRVLTRHDPFYGVVKGCQVTVCGYFSDTRGAWVMDNETCEVEPEKVTHWMELPPPPTN